MYDLNVAIIPGHSAAGFEIGQQEGEIFPRSGRVTLWDPDTMESLEYFVKRVAAPGSWVLHRSSGPESFSSLFLAGGAVRLSFGKTGILYQITVFSGYKGRFMGLSVGCTLADLAATVDIEYDDGDEAYYATEIRGIAFIPEILDPPCHPDQTIRGISVHDWSLQT